MKIINLLEKKNIQKAASLLFNSKEAIALTGAGISTESGIPDFRSEGYSFFLSKNPEVFNPRVKPAHSQKHERRDNNANHLISIPLTAPD